MSEPIIRKNGYKLGGFNWHKNTVDVIYGGGELDTLTLWKAYQFLSQMIEGGEALADKESARRYLALRAIFKGLREE